MGIDPKHHIHLDEITESYHKACSEAYERGRRDGAAEARSELKARMELALADTKSEQVATIPGTSVSDTIPVERAERGIVRPAVEAAMQRAGRGLRSREVCRLVHADGHTTIKENTVRAQLNKWKAENKVRKVGNLWHLNPSVQQTGESAPIRHINGGDNSLFSTPQ